jgi:catechol 2,3-dioxygenase-like lactoylglutathione lyase family enzyme
MRLNHLDLHVPDVVETRDFFIKFLEFKLVSSPTASALAILEDGAGFVLVLQTQKHPSESYPAGFHIGFSVSERSAVNERRRLMAEAGHRVSEIESNKRGYFFYVHAPGGFFVEINCR